MADSEFNSANKINGATIDIIDEGDGHYLVKQIVPARAPVKPAPGDHSISWSYGPLTLTGTVNTTTLYIGVNITVLGISLGSFGGNLKDGVSIKVDLIAVKGSVKFSLKNEKEVWVTLALKVIFDGNYETSHKLITI